MIVYRHRSYILILFSRKECLVTLGMMDIVIRNALHLLFLTCRFDILDYLVSHKAFDASLFQFLRSDY